MQLTKRTLHHLIEHYYRMGYTDIAYSNQPWQQLIKNSHAKTKLIQIRKPVVLEVLSHAYLQGKSESRIGTRVEPTHNFQTLLNQELDYANWRINYEKA